MDEVIDGEAVEITEEGANLPVASPPTQSTALVARDEIDVSELVGQSAVIHQAMVQAMQDGIHYGKIPGVDKPTLLKPGAEKLLVLFRLAPAYESEKIWHEDGHLTVMVKCILHHIPTGLKIAEGEGLCTTRESRYAWRKGGRICPECGQPAIIKGKAEYGGGWICFAKKGGCGAKWADNTEQAEEFETANLDRVPNPDLPDTYNTVLKMGDKRALLAAVLNGTAASDVFTQDMEDSDRGGSDEGRTSSSQPQQQQQQQRSQEPQKPKEFSPEDDLRPDAPKVKSGWKGIKTILNEIDPSINWDNVTGQAIRQFYGVASSSDLDEEQKRKAWYRSANFAGRLSELYSEETFLSHESIQKAIAENFGGIAITVAEFTESQT